MTEDNNKDNNKNNRHKKTADGTDGKPAANMPPKAADSKGGETDTVYTTKNHSTKDAKRRKSAGTTGMSTSNPEDSDTEKIDWHAGFVHAMRLYLRHYEDSLQFEEEYQLTRKALRIDLTVIKKRSDAVIDNNIGRFFRKHNLLEYKSPDAKLDLAVFYKVIAYACLYVSLPSNLTQKGQPINKNDVTVTFVRATYPRRLLRDLQNDGYTVTVSDMSDDIYYVEGAVFPVQIVVTRQPEKSESGENETESDMIWLSAMTNNITKETFTEFMSMTGNLNARQLQYAGTVTQVVSAANEQEIEAWKEAETDMNSALRRIMADELEESWNSGLEEGRNEGLSVGRSEGRNEGLIAGRNEGLIEGAISTYRELGISMGDATRRIILKFSLPKDKADSYIEKYW